jgi:hypothetical protein
LPEQIRKLPCGLMRALGAGDRTRSRIYPALMATEIP